MPKKWIDDPALLDSMADHLIATVSLFPKRLLHVDELSRAFHMPISQIQVLVMASKGDLSIGQLSERLGVAKPNITPLVDALVERGYISRIRSEQDRRILQVHILDEGTACLRDIRNMISNQISEWPLRLSKSEAKQLNASLAFMVRLMEQMNNQED